MIGKILGKKQNGPDLNRALKQTQSAREAEGFALRKKRSTPRRDTWHVCEIIYDTGYRLAGMMVDISATGCRVKFRIRSDIPPEVTVTVPDLQYEQRAKVVWQNTFEAGFLFV